MSERVDILIEHGTILTINKDRHIITDGTVAIRKDRIVAVGKTWFTQKLRRRQDDRCIPESRLCQAWSTVTRISAK